MKNMQSLVENSMLWAAYGDALGFITELADEVSGVKWRSGNIAVQNTIPWRRKLGGLFGVTAKFPAGTYSDDTQLRLATSRAISANGMFDVEAFAKIELPLWNCYALGAGRGTKDAALNLTKKNVRWNSNFYKASKGGRNYIDSGGNGAAMRVQPHVWANLDKNNFSVIANDVVRNAITTHGHPHAIIGSVFHALCLYEVLKLGIVPSPESWVELAIRSADYTLQSIQNDSDLSTVWLSQWNNISGKSYIDTHNATALEIKTMAVSISLYFKNNISYKMLAEEFDASNPNIRGMASLTSLLAIAAAFIQTTQNENTILEVVNCLGTDTDTIATMAGALIGAVSQIKPSGALQDINLLVNEANRLVDISEGKVTRKFQYPSLLTWRAPSKFSELVKKIDGSLIIPGLGEVVINEKVGEAQGVTWAWSTLSFGQTIIIKLSDQFERLSNNQFPILPYESNGNLRNKIEFIASNKQMSFDKLTHFHDVNEFVKLDANKAFELAKRANFAADEIGKLIIELTKLDNQMLETVSAFSILISKAILERSKKMSDKI